uniref:restriction endonuclease subunit S n=1 Tax=Fusobacterium sp. TaxID=68766 RepID=UPI002623F713
MIKFVLENFDTIFKSKDSLENLDKLILDLAIKGKLVEQNPNDEPASELLKRIKEEKQRLIDEKVIKKEKPLPPIEEDEKPFKIPSNWEWVRLEDIILKIKYGFTASAIDTGEIKFLRITDIQNNKVNWENVPYCKITNEEYKNYKLEKRDILIARTGGTVGKTFLINDDLNQILSVYASYLINIKPSININEKYLKNYFETNLYWELIKEKSQGTGQPNVNAPSLKSLIIPLPPVEEQKRIVEKVEKLQQLTKKLKEIYISNEDNRQLLKKAVLLEIENSGNDKELLKNLEIVFSNFDKIVK